jgi:predicted site-specific integrase-resolvase
MDEERYISVSSYAKKIGKSTQMVYNYINEGKLPHIVFERGRYRGILVKDTTLTQQE